MEKLTLKELQLKAQDTFDCYPNIDKLWAVENGIFFLDKQKGDAASYASRQKLAEPVEITRAEAEAAVKAAENVKADAVAKEEAKGVATANTAPAEPAAPYITAKEEEPATKKATKQSKKATTRVAATK